MSEAQTVPLTHNWSAEHWDWPLQANDGVVKVLNTGEKFEVGLSVGEFKPNEIQVSVIGDEISIHAKHEVRSDAHGAIARELHRVYRLPAGVNKSTLKSHLSHQGTLVISASKQ